MATEGKVPILESVREGWSFTRVSLRAVAPAGILCAAIFALTETVGATHAAPNALDLLLSLISIGLSIAFSAFALRLALRQDASGFYGLKFGKDETRLLGAALVVAFFFMIVFIVGIVVFSIALAVAAPRAGVDLTTLGDDPAAAQAAIVAILTGPDAPLVWTVLLALLALVLWLSARLFLVSAATIGEGRIMAFSTWEWTRGNALRILAAIFATLLPLAFAVGFAVGVIGGALGVESTPQGVTGPIAARALVQFLRGAGQFLLITPAMTGLMAHLYRGLRPPELAAPSPAS